MPVVLYRVMQDASTRIPAQQFESDEEAVLVQRAKAADPEAWSDIYRLYHRPIFRYFLGRMGDAHVCEDLAANVFLQAVKGINSYTYKGTPFVTWLYRIARNVAADYYRSELGRRPAGATPPRSRVPWLFRRDSSDREPGNEDRITAEPSENGINVERLDLKNAVQALDASQREIIALHYYAGFSLREVAHILGMNERKVYSVQARALLQLRRQMAS